MLVSFISAQQGIHQATLTGLVGPPHRFFKGCVLCAGPVRETLGKETKRGKGAHKRRDPWGKLLSLRTLKNPHQKKKRNEKGGQQEDPWGGTQTEGIPLKKTSSKETKRGAIQKTREGDPYLIKRNEKGGKFFPLFPLLFRCIFSFAREETLMAAQATLFKSSWSFLFPFF